MSALAESASSDVKLATPKRNHKKVSLDGVNTEMFLSLTALTTKFYHPKRSVPHLSQPLNRLNDTVNTPRFLT